MPEDNHESRQIPGLTEKNALTSSEDGLGVLDGGGEDAEGVVQRPLGLAQDLLCGAPDDDGARLAQGDARELEERLVADHHLLDEVALPDLQGSGIQQDNNNALQKSMG